LLNLARQSHLPLVVTISCGLLSGLSVIGLAAGLSRIVEGVFLGGLILSNFRGLLGFLLVIVLMRALLVWGSEVSANAVAVRVKSNLRQRLL
jgi:ABC-type transport system involved in cytochrome bd biosynthesis fused ATPase/permease subunit